MNTRNQSAKDPGTSKKALSAAEGDGSWTDVLLVEQPEPTISYRTAMVVYEESLIKGQFVGRGWNGSGNINFKAGRYDPTQYATPQAFWLEIDGRLLAYDWQWEGLEKKTEVRDGPQGQCRCLHVTVSLRHALRPVTVKVHTLLDGTAVLTRWLEVTNTATQPAAMSAAYSWSGVLQKTERWQSYLSSTAQPLYSIGYFDDTRWGNEGDFQWHDLPAARYCIDGRYRRERHRHPMFVLRNNATGEHFVAQLAWSGGYIFEFDLDAAPGTSDLEAKLSFRAGPDAPAPQRMIAPGETIQTPEVHLGVTFGGLDEALHAMHDHLRRSVFMPQPRGRGCWVEFGIGPMAEITPEKTMHAIDMAADCGAEVFFIDASWYAPPHSDWEPTVGDWEVNRERFPDGLEPIRRRVHELGMLWGLWMDAERIGAQSRTVKEHPDWLVRRYDGEQFLGMIDLTKPEVAEWMERQIIRVIEENELDFFRLDYNTHGVGRNAQDPDAECHFWRYCEAVYAVYDRLRRRFPDVIFENCAGGGGRTDIGLVRRFSHTWVSDWEQAPRSFAVVNGMTMALPPEYIDRVIGGYISHLTAEFDFLWRVMMFARPTIGYSIPLGAEWNPHILAKARSCIELYKNFIRPFMPTGRIYHHTPCLDHPEPKGWGVLELASRDRSRAICGLFQLSSPTDPEYLLRLRGLDAARRYRVTFDNTAQSCELDGAALMRQGLTIRLEGALTSELLIIEAVEG